MEKSWPSNFCTVDTHFVCNLQIKLQMKHELINKELK